MKSVRKHYICTLHFMKSDMDQEHKKSSGLKGRNDYHVKNDARCLHLRKHKKFIFSCFLKMGLKTLTIFLTIFMAVALLPGSVCAQSAGKSVGGEWSGSLELGGGHKLKLVLHIDEPASSITMDSPDQGAFGLECVTHYLSSDSVSLSIPSLRMSYEGSFKGDKLEGTFQQSGMTLPLAFSRGVEKRNRPQTPRPPFTYQTEEVTISNPAIGAVLGGTLSVPENCTSTTPVVVFVSGSGPSNRDEELFEHKPFAVMADYLARNGVASLRYDDRGVGESTGDRTNATTADYASDAKVVIDWLRSQKRFGKVGMIGHSEGGLIAYMLGASDDGPDFIVSIAGPAVRGYEILNYQNKQALMKNGMTEPQAAEYAAAAIERIEADPSMTWMHYFLKHDPAPDMQKLDIPTFIIYGEKDSQVPPSLNYDTAKRLAPNAEVRCYPGLNHLMQHAVTGGVEEYGEIEETISPQVLTDIVGFIKNK